MDRLHYALFSGLANGRLGNMLFVALLAVVLSCGVVGCSKEESFASLGSDVPALRFSCDTLSFDTVFCTMGSTTRQVRVFNDGDEAVLLTSVTLAGGRASRFRLNVDGDTAMEARDVTIEGGDSIFIFVQVNINPNDALSPFIVEDAIVFHVQGCARQRLPLTAWGRNAVYHIPTNTLRDADGNPFTDRYGNAYAYSVIDCKAWDHTRPHVIVGYAVVDEDSVLNLEAGDELYFGNDAVLWIYNGGQLNANGSEEQPVLFTSLRHDGWYDELPGQWGHIWLGGLSGERYGSSRPCVMRHVRIENSYYGVMADSNDFGAPTLTIEESEIEHVKVAALMGSDSWIVGRQLLLADCGGATIYVPFGGRYLFEHVTSANYWKYDSRTTASVVLSNIYDYGSGMLVRDLTEAYFKDCIIYGSRRDGEVQLIRADEAAFGVTFDHCLIRGGTWDEDPQFVDVENGDYSLKEDSPAVGIGRIK